MGKRTQTLDRGRLEKSVMDRWIYAWGVWITQKNICEMQNKWKDAGRSAWPHLSSMVEVMWWSGAGKVGDLYKVKGILNKEGYHSILQCHAIPCGQRLIGANFLLQQDNDPKHTSMQELFREEAVSWYSVCNGVASAVTRSQPYWAVVGAAWPYGT